MADAEVLVVGLARNVARTLAADVARLGAALQGFRAVHWLLVESDSDDDTLGTLRALQRAHAGFDHLSLGRLQPQWPERTERIAHCRNAYLQRLREDARYAAVQYVVVADFDGLNDRIDAAAIRSCWQRDDWDMCAANQAGPYYDIWALRHPLWSPNDCWEQHRFLSSYLGLREQVLYLAVHARMIRIPPDGEWIEVESAFGGLAVYRRHAFDAMAAYRGTEADGRPVCEHVPLHRAMRERGLRLFVNPALVNAGRTEHGRELRFARRVERVLRNAWVALRSA